MSIIIRILSFIYYSFIRFIRLSRGYILVTIEYLRTIKYIRFRRS